MDPKLIENKSSILDEHPPLPRACITMLGARQLHWFLAKALLVAVAVALCWTGPSANAADTNRLIVKLRPALAGEMESWVTTSQAGLTQLPQGAKTWLAKHNLNHVQPVYPRLVRAKRQSGQSYRQMAELVQEKFPRRAVRRTGAFNPPEIERTYLVVPNEVTFTLPETSVLHGPTNVAELGFTALSNQQSAFVALPITDVTGLKPDGTPAASWYGYPGRVALIGDEPLLEALRADTNNALVILYGHPGTNYILLSTTNGLGIPIWLPETAINATNLETWVIWTNQGEPTRFFRARSE